MATLYFGEKWDAPFLDEAESIKQIPTPIGQNCYQCGESVLEGERGLLRPIIRGTADDPTTNFEPIHMECDLRAVLGHMLGVCPCAGYGMGREAARETLKRQNALRVASGRDPL